MFYLANAEAEGKSFEGRKNLIDKLLQQCRQYLAGEQSKNLNMEISLICRQQLLKYSGSE